MSHLPKAILLCLSHLSSVLGALLVGAAATLYSIDVGYRNFVKTFEFPGEEPLPLVTGFWLDAAKSKLEHIRNMGGGGALVLWYGDYAAAQRKHGDYEQYRDVLLDWIEIQKLLKTRGHLASSTEELFHTDRLFAYIGLSRLENENGHPEESRRYMGLAFEECGLSRFRDECTPEDLNHIADTMREMRRNPKRGGGEMRTLEDLRNFQIKRADE